MGQHDDKLLAMGIDIFQGVTPRNLLWTKAKGTPLAIHDGDTITADIKQGVGRYKRLYSLSESIRAMGFDAWEVTRLRDSKITSEELAKGVIARDALRALVATGSLEISVQDIEEPNGRTLAYLRVRQKNNVLCYVAEYMTVNGHCRPTPGHP